jgi:membrane protease YdiL (CAAX protease family)
MSEQQSEELPQYRLSKILLVWAAAAIPMGILGWVVAPSLASNSNHPGFERLAVLTIGLVWQFLLILYLLYDEAGTLSWSTVRTRLQLRSPSLPQDNEPQNRLWWWIVPLIVLTATYQLFLGGKVQKFWVSLFPLLAEPEGFSLSAALNMPEVRAQLVGNWWVLALYIVSALFNTVLGEELLFRGILLPRMAGVCKKWDWVANGILFGLYHLHQPWGMLMSAIQGTFLFAFPSRYFRSTWFGIIAHSGQSLFLSFLILGLVLGRA